MARMFRLALLSACLFSVVSSAAGIPQSNLATAAGVPQLSRIAVNPITGERSTFLSVLTYNIAGLPWPIATSRAGNLPKITDGLRYWNYTSQAPEVVLVQEAFTKQGYAIGTNAAYPYRARGPSARDSTGTLHASRYRDFIQERSLWKGERSGKWFGSGLAVFSKYPISERISQPFLRRECAGYDCLANKGMLLVRISIPGVPVPVDIVTTHLNSRGSSGVPEARSLFAHERQVDELAAFIGTHHAQSNLLIIGGDFNIRRSTERRHYLQAQLPYSFVRTYCEQTPVCRSGATPWQNYQDQQGFLAVSGVHIEPVHEEEVFTAPVDGRMLSDHNGYLVVYRISWYVPEES